MALCHLTGRPAVVLGSTQRRAIVNDSVCEALGIDVVRRATGGGAVLVAPEAQVWIDVWIPRGDRLWSDDVIKAASWLGHVWVTALESMGLDDGRVHTAGLLRSQWSDAICFGGVGPGEVLTGPTKVVGVAQRRTGLGARFHTVTPLVWAPDALVSLLQLDRDAAAAATAYLSGAAVGLADVVTPGRGAPASAVVTAVEEAFLTALP